MNFICEYCDYTTTDKSNYAKHCNGKKHKFYLANNKILQTQSQIVFKKTIYL